MSRLAQDIILAELAEQGANTPAKIKEVLQKFAPAYDMRIDILETMDPNAIVYVVRRPTL